MKSLVDWGEIHRRRKEAAARERAMASHVAARVRMEARVAMEAKAAGTAAIEVRGATPERYGHMHSPYPVQADPHTTYPHTPDTCAPDTDTTPHPHTETHSLK